MIPNELPPHVQLMKYIVARWISKPIYVVAELGIADMLADGPKSIDELARASESHAPTLYRVMRALASVGIFVETEDKQFELTPMAALLKSDAMRSIALMFNSEWSDKAWGFFLESVKTGDTAFEMAHGMPVCAWLEKNPRAAEVFNEANAIKAAGWHRAILNAYDFAEINSLTDVGGGVGALLVEILKAHPTMHGVVADLPSVVWKAEKTIWNHKLTDRCQTIACDFFKEIPSGSDVFIMSNILHDWPDDICMTILRNCHDAMKPKSRLLVVEMVVPPGNEPSISKLLDLEMLVITGGRERTEAEFRTLFDAAGFEFNRIIPTEEGVCILEGTRD